MRIAKLSILSLIITTLVWSCQKEYSLEGSLIKLPVGTWQFNDSNKLYVGNMDTAYIDTTNPTKVLHLLGTSSTGNESFSISLFSLDSFKLGTYHALLSECEFDYFSLSTTIYQTDILTGEFIVTISQLANNHISGTFSGLTIDSVGNSKMITLGKFSSAIKLKAAGSGAVATGSLGLSSGSCTPITISGVYTQGIAIDATNTVQVQVTVATAGTYTISSNTVNGVSFSKSGLFTSIGVQNVVMTGTGTPVNSGAQNYSISFGSSVCNFSITYIAGTPPPPVLDYFPTTLNSNWVYYSSSPDSTTTKVINYNPVIAGNTYSSFENNTIPPSAKDTSYYRKLGNDYYTYTDLANSFAFTNPTPVEYIFLKDNVVQGATWQSANFSGTIPGLGPAMGYISMTLLAKAVSVTVGSQTFPDVIKVQYDYYLIPGGLVGTEEKWFARGVGLVHYFSAPTLIEVNRYTIY